MVNEDLAKQSVGSLLELVNDCVVQRILVLLEPAGKIVWHLIRDTRVPSVTVPSATVH